MFFVLVSCVQPIDVLEKHPRNCKPNSLIQGWRRKEGGEGGGRILC